MATNESSSEFNEDIDQIQLFRRKLEELVEKARTGMNNTNDVDIHMKNVWQNAFTMWTRTMELLINPPNNTVATSYDDCSYLFLNEIFYGLGLQKFVEKNGSLAYEMFFSSLDLLNILIVDQHQLDNNDTDTLNNVTVRYYLYALLFLSRVSCTYVPFTDELVNNYVTLLNVLKIHVDKQIMNDLSTKEREFDFVTAEILILLWNMADRTILAPSLILANLPNYAVRWLANSSCLKVDATESLIRIIYNMTRHDDGADEFNKHGAIDAVKDYQSR